MFSLQPQFFDIFGVIGFAYIAMYSILAITGKKIPKWMTVLLLLTGVAGLMVDLAIVFKFYL